MDRALGSLPFGAEIQPAKQHNTITNTNTDPNNTKVQRKRARQSKDVAETEADPSSQPISKKAAWVDEDDESLVVNLVDNTITKKLVGKQKSRKKVSGEEFSLQLRAQYEALNPLPAWVNSTPSASFDSDSEAEAEAEALLTRAEPLVQQNHQLSEKHLSYRSYGVLDPHIGSNQFSSLQFHPDGEMCLLAGGSTVKLFNIREQKSKQIIKYNIKGPKNKSLSVQKAEFFNDAAEVFLLSSLPTFHTIDLASGNIIEHFSLKKEVAPNDLLNVLVGSQILFVFARGGRILCIDPKSKNFVSEIRTNSEQTAFCLSPNQQYLYTAGTEGVINQWDISTRKIVHKYTDEGSLHTTALTISPDGKWQAAGSSSGIVNIYDLNQVTEKKAQAPTPIKRIENLVTRVDKVLFNPTSQLLVASSEQAMKNEKVRLAHVPSWKLLPNFPAQHQINGRFYDFSPASDMFISASGNKVQLFGLDYFKKGSRYY